MRAQKIISDENLPHQMAEVVARVDQIVNGIDDIKRLLQQLEERVRALEHSDAASHPLMQARLDTAWQRLNDHEKRIIMLTDITTHLKHTNRTMLWFASILGSTVIVWLITQILGIIK